MWNAWSFQEKFIESTWAAMMQKKGEKSCVFVDFNKWKYIGCFDSLTKYLPGE